MAQANLEPFCRARAQTLSLVEPLSQAQLDYLPEPGEWSIGEVVDHLNLAERAMRNDVAILIDLAKAGRRPYLYRSFADFNARPAMVPECALPFLELPLNLINTVAPPAIREYFVRYVPIRALSPDVLLPQKGNDKAALLQELRLEQRETQALFAANPALDYHRMRQQHPLFGVHTVPQLLRTMRLHEEAHQDQIARVLRRPGFPRSA